MSGKGVKVESPARLHLGILDMKGDLGRIHGSIGVTIKKPSVKVEIRKSNETKVRGKQRQRTTTFLERLKEKLHIDQHFTIRILDVIPPHVGLGSGTQLALSIGAGISKLLNLTLEVEEISSAMGRGTLSGIGTFAFKKGGFIIDGGHKINDFSTLPPLIYHRRFPEDWFFVVAIPNIERGLSGPKENAAMDSLPSRLREKDVNIGQISRLVLMNMLPALEEKDIREFSKSLSQLEEKVGEMFSFIQKGTFRAEIIDSGIQFLLANGALGGGQSSWGPSFYGIIKDKTQAKKLKENVSEFLDERTGGITFYTTANNQGAKISFSS